MACMYFGFSGFWCLHQSLFFHMPEDTKAAALRTTSWDIELAEVTEASGRKRQLCTPRADYKGEDHAGCRMSSQNLGIIELLQPDQNSAIFVGLHSRPLTRSKSCSHLWGSFEKSAPHQPFLDYGVPLHPLSVLYSLSVSLQITSFRNRRLSLDLEVTHYPLRFDRARAGQTELGTTAFACQLLLIFKPKSSTNISKI